MENKIKEIDAFVRKYTFDLKKILEKKVLMDTLEKTPLNIFAYPFISEHSKHFFSFSE